MSLADMEEIFQFDRRFGVVNVLGEDHLPEDGFSIGSQIAAAGSGVSRRRPRGVGRLMPTSCYVVEIYVEDIMVQPCSTDVI